MRWIERIAGMRPVGLIGAITRGNKALDFSGCAPRSLPLPTVNSMWCVVFRISYHLPAKYYMEYVTGVSDVKMKNFEKTDVT